LGEVERMKDEGEMFDLGTGGVIRIRKLSDLDKEFEEINKVTEEELQKFSDNLYKYQQELLFGKKKDEE